MPAIEAPPAAKGKRRSAHPLDKGVELAIDLAAILGLRRLSHGLGAYPGRSQLKLCGAGSALVPPHASADEYRRHAPFKWEVPPRAESQSSRDDMGGNSGDNTRLLSRGEII